MFSVSVFYDERIVVVAEQRPDASEEDSFQWMSRVLQVQPGETLLVLGCGQSRGHRRGPDGGSPGMEGAQGWRYHRDGGITSFVSLLAQGVFVQGHKLGASAVSKLFCGVLRELE